MNSRYRLTLCLILFTCLQACKSDADLDDRISRKSPAQQSMHGDNDQDDRDDQD